jgi:hypothetical protein
MAAPISDIMLERWPTLVSIPVTQFTGVAGVRTTVSGDAQTAVGNIFSPVNTNLVEDINSTGLYGLKMNTAGDSVNHLWQHPPDIDFSKPIRTRVRWTSGSSTTADTITWKVFRKVMTPNTTSLTNTISTALDTAIPQDTVPVATAFALCHTAYGKWNASADFGPAYSHLLKVEMDAKAVGLAEDIYLLGLDILYTPIISPGAIVSGVPQTGQGRESDLPAGWAAS